MLVLIEDIRPFLCQDHELTDDCSLPWYISAGIRGLCGGALLLRSHSPASTKHLRQEADSDHLLNYVLAFDHC